MGSTLADYVWGDKKNNFTGFYGQASAGAYTQLSNGTSGTKIPTLADVGAAEKPEDKLKLLQRMADVVGIQADASLATGRSDTVASMTRSAKEMLSALGSVVDGLTGDTATTSYKTEISATLTSLRNAMDKLGSLGGNGSTDMASELAIMDNQAGDVAASAGLSWRRTGTTFRADPTKLVDLLV